MTLNTVEKYRAFLKVLLPIYNLLASSVKGKKKNKLDLGVSLLKKSRIVFSGYNNQVHVGDYSRLINCSITILGSGCRVYIGSRCYLNGVNIYMEDDNNCLSIGSHSSVDGKTEFALIEGTVIDVGNDCMFSRDIHIRTGDSHSIINDQNIRINPSKNIRIGNHVWVCTKTMILKGVSINDNSIVAAGSVVTGSEYPENSVIGGVPSKVIKTGISWTRKRILVNNDCSQVYER